MGVGVWVGDPVGVEVSLDEPVVVAVVDAEEDALDDSEAVEVRVEWGVRLLVFVTGAEREAGVNPDGVGDRDPVGVALVLGVGEAVGLEVGEAVGAALRVPEAVIIAVDGPLSMEDRVDGGLRDAVQLPVLELKPLMVGVGVELLVPELEPLGVSLGLVVGVPELEPLGVSLRLVVGVPEGEIRGARARIRLLYESAMYTLPLKSTDKPNGLASKAFMPALLSPPNPKTPLPAIVVMTPLLVVHMRMRLLP